MIVYQREPASRPAAPALILAGLFFAITTFTLYRLNINPVAFLNPVPEKISAFDRIKSKLKERVNTYSLKKESGSLVPYALASTVQNVDAASYVVIDYDNGAIIEEKNGEKKLPIASITKVMTTVVALDLADPSEMFTVSERAAAQIPTKIGVKPGQQFTLHELLQAALLTSANDAVEVINDGVDTKYGEKLFIKAMNEKAKNIGLKNTHYANPQGFDDPENYSSVRDQAVLAHYALTHYPLIAEIAAKDFELLSPTGTHRRHDLYNWNGLLGVYPGTSGLKIGNTDAAGKTTVVVAEREGKKILVVLLGAPGVLERDMWAAELLDLGFERTLGLKPVGVTEDQLRAKYATWKYW